MPFINLAPYSDIHNLNLDWIIDTMKELVKAWEGYGAKVTATAHLADRPGVEVTGDFKTEVNFDFAIVRGEKGEPGKDGERGEQGVPGPQGAGLQILDTYETIEDLRRAHATGRPGDAYLVGRNNVYVLYIWSTEYNDWHEAGSLSSPSPSSESPLMDGEASAGVGLTYSRNDHRHPSDVAKLDKATNDGTKTELYAIAGTEQNVIEVTDVPATGKVVMYDQVRGNVRTQEPIEDNDCVRKVDLKSVEDDLDELTANGVLPVVAESQAPTLIGYPSTGESGFLTFSSNSDGDPTVKVTFDGYSRDGEMVDVYDQVAFDKEFFNLANNHMKLKLKTINGQDVNGEGNIIISPQARVFIDIDRLIASGTADTYVATEDCWIGAKNTNTTTSSPKFKLEGVTVSEQGATLLLLKQGQTITCHAGGSQGLSNMNYTVYGLK